jgi:hypothetical protein
MLDSLLTWSREIILTNMKRSASPTLGILKSLYPRANLDVAGQGFAATYSDEEALKLLEDYCDGGAYHRYAPDRYALV